jgi:hypothetical protein
MGLIEINNPGKGNCGFYAFAIGLLHVMQKEILNDKAVVTNKFLSSLSKESRASLAEALGIKEATDDALKARLATLNIQRLNAAQWEFFNQHLRQQLYQLRLDDLKNLKSLEASLDYSDAVSIILLYCEREVKSDALNYDFRQNELFTIKAKKLASKIRQYENLERRLSEIEIRKIVIVSLFTEQFGVNINSALACDLENVYRYSETSAIQKVIQSKKDSNEWATHGELARLAIYYQVHLATYVGEESKSYGKNESHWPTIHVNRLLWSKHWTTLVDDSDLQKIQAQQKAQTKVSSPKMEIIVTMNKKTNEIPNRYLQRFLSTMPTVRPVSSKEQESATVTSIEVKSPLTKLIQDSECIIGTEKASFTMKKDKVIAPITFEEIAKIFRVYTRDNSRWCRIFRLEWGHTHIDLAKSIIEECEQNNKAATIASVIELIKNSFPAGCNPEGAYVKCVKQVLSRYKGEEWAIRTLEKLLAKKQPPPPKINW